MTAGTAVTYHHTFGWETYNWSKPAAGVRPASFTSVAVAQEAVGSRALAVTVTCPVDGVVSVLYGRRAGSYGAKTAPVTVAAATAKTIRLTDLIIGQTYYVDVVYTGTIPNAANGLPVYVQAQYGELSAVAQ